MISRGKAIKVLPVLCILLVAISGFAQAIHVHCEKSNLPSHECSICVVAHSGVLTNPVYRPVLIFVRTALFVPSDVTGESSAFAFSLHIRPPPTV